MKTKIIFEILKDNEVIERIEKDSKDFLDLFTKVGLKYIYGYCLIRSSNVTLIDEGGSQFNIYVDYDPDREPYGYPNCKLIDSIAIGSGTTAPSFNDYKLENKKYEVTATIKNYTEDIQNNQIYFDVEATFNISQQETFYEVGIFGLAVQIYSGFPWSIRKVLVSRDVIPSGITVPANSTLKVTYRIYFSQ
ncbi:MAG: hypothetical protein QW047_08830 [Sulfolobales archaeon]